MVRGTDIGEHLHAFRQQVGWRTAAAVLALCLLSAAFNGVQLWTIGHGTLLTVVAWLWPAPLLVVAIVYLRGGRPWARQLFLVTLLAVVTTTGLAETEVGTLLVVGVGCPGLLAVALTMRPAREFLAWKLGASILFALVLLGRHLLRPMAVFPNDIELIGAAISGAVGVFFTGTLMDMLQRTLAQTVGALVAKNDELERSRGEMERARDRALSSSRAKARFLANMSHELRTPLNAIVGYAEMVEEELAETQRLPEVAEDLARIQFAAGHLLGLVSDVLDLTRLEAGDADVDVISFDVTGVVQQLVAELRPRVEAQGNRFVIDLDNTVGELRTDRTRLRQVLTALLDNAARFTRRGEVRLVVRPDTRWRTGVRFEVHDTGVGIPASVQANLFEPFLQGDTSPTRQHDGAGLGLAISRNYTEMLGGCLEFTSEVGCGSVFTAWLPSLVDVAAASRQALQPLPAERAYSSV